jgi:hypothetical protein
MNDVTSLKESIEKMTKNHQIEILRILKNSPSIKLNENKSGVFVNLSFLPTDVIKDISKYVSYIREQEYTLETVESQKNTFKNEFFATHEA